MLLLEGKSRIVGDVAAVAVAVAAVGEAGPLIADEAEAVVLAAQAQWVGMPSTLLFRHYVQE